MVHRLMLILFILFTQKIYSLDKELNLNIGKSIEVQFKNSETINISTKNLINTYFQEESGTWKITALKSGFVIVTPDSEVDHRLLITIPEQKKNVVKISKEISKIEKVFDDAVSFFKEKKACEMQKKCIFLGRLTKKAGEKWQEYLKVRFFLDDVETNAFGQSLIYVACKNNKIIEEIPQKIRLHLDIQQRCFNQKENNNYLLSARVFLVNDVSGSLLGAEYDQPITIKNYLGKENISLYAKKNSSKIKIIGEPIFRLVANEESNIVSGGEIQSLQTHSNESVSEEWKKYGIELKILLNPIDENKILLDYKFSIRTPTKQSSQMQLSAIDSKIIVDLGKEMTGGGFVISSADEDKNSVPFFEQIPIIAPLFHLFSEKKSEQRMIISFQIEKEMSMGSSESKIQKSLKF